MTILRRKQAFDVFDAVADAAATHELHRLDETAASQSIDRPRTHAQQIGEFLPGQ